MPRSRKRDSLNPLSPELKPRPDWVSRTVPIYPTGYEGPTDRFPPPDITDERLVSHFLNPGRNNLTALSQRHNLLFLAFHDRVQVFEPLFPNQRLGRVPRLELPPPPSRRESHIPPGLDRREPQGINNVLVGDLGDQEILLLARDDGDLVAYNVGKIADEVERREYCDEPQELVCHDIRPFFHQCVGCSAWGLSIHKEARMIAASCNLYTVSVFAFALNSTASAVDGLQRQDNEDDDDDDDEEDSSDSNMTDQDVGLDAVLSDLNVTAAERQQYKVLLKLDPDWIEYTGRPPHRPNLFQSRRRNFRVLLLGIRSNIPAIAFCNTGDDPTARYMIGTGINGTTIIWSIEGRQIVRTLTPNGYSDDFDRWRGGWGLQWLQKDAFFPTRIPAEALGTQKATRMTFPQHNMMILNTSSARNKVAQNKFWNPFAPREDEGDELHQGTLNLPNQRSIVQFDDNENFEIAPEDLLLGLERPAPVEAPLEDGTPLPDLSQRRRMDQIEARVTYLHAHWPLGTMHSSTSHGTVDPELIYNQFSCPLMLFTSQHVHLMQHGWFEAMSNSSPAISMYNPLEQSLVDTNQLGGLDIFDRMNLIAQIPELGVVIAGSGKGRVGVFSLHALEHNPFSPNSQEPVRTMRLNHILPTADQEDAGQRPVSLLGGVAVSPIQGSQSQRAGSSSVRRWRLMLTYLDLTVLSYEIGHLGGAGVEVMI